VCRLSAKLQKPRPLLVSASSKGNYSNLSPKKALQSIAKSCKSVNASNGYMLQVTAPNVKEVNENQRKIKVSSIQKH
jgi:hypothetical protein